jgi:hypothetical protein
MKKHIIKESEEQIKRVLLMMKYDTSKTLTENKEKVVTVIKEQTQQSCQNQISDNDIKTKSERVGDLIKYMNTSFLRMGYIDDRCKEIFDTIKELSTKNYFNTTKNTCVNSLVRFKQNFEYYYRDWWTKGETFEEEIQSLIDGYIGKQSVNAKEYLEETLNIFKLNKDKKVEIKSTPNPEKKQTPCPIPGGIERVKIFQKWLNQYVKGWHEKYPNGLPEEPSKGFGVCGARTRKQWGIHKNEFSNPKQTNPTDTEKIEPETVKSKSISLPVNTTEPELK